MFKALSQIFQPAVQTAVQQLKPSESDEVKTFLAQSEEYQHMLKITASAREKKPLSTDSKDPSKKNDPVNIMHNIHHAKTFSDLLTATDDLNFDHTQDPVAKKLGKKGMNALFFVGGYVSNNFNFAYYALHFRNKVQAIVAQINRNTPH